MSKNVKLSAAAIKKTSPQGVFIYATADPSILDSENAVEDIVAETAGAMTAYVCASCDTHITASTQGSPFCINCGSHSLVATTDEPATIEASTVLAGIACHNCNTTHAITAHVITACNNSIHCSSCGEHLQIHASAETFDEVPPVEMTAQEMPEEMPEEELTAGEDPLDQMLPSADEVQAAMDEQPLELVDTQVEAAPEMSEDEISLDATMSEEDDVSTEELPEPISAEATDEEMVSDGGVAEELVAAPDDGMELEAGKKGLAPVTKHDEFEGVKDDRGSILADALGVDDTSSNLTFSLVSNRLVASKGHVSVFSLRASDAGANADIMNTATFSKAVLHHVSAKGLRAGLTQLGFKPVRVPVVTKQEITASIASVRKDFQDKEKAVKASMEDCFAIAAVGLSRGSFKGYENPLRAAFEVELSTQGVRNPKKIAAALFDKYGVQFTQSLVELSAKLSKMTVEARKDTADMLKMTREVVTAEVDETEEDTNMQNSTPIEARLAVTASMLRTGKGQVVTASSVLDKANSILSGNQPLNFF